MLANRMALKEKQKKKMFYAPIAFVIRSKTEFHDAFKLLLQKIYESLTCPRDFTKSIVLDYERRRETSNRELFKHLPSDAKKFMSFAELIANIAFLRTIPAPVFNSEATIMFQDVLINLKENSFNKLPHKNLESIKILIECLDF